MPRKPSQGFRTIFDLERKLVGSSSLCTRWFSENVRFRDENGDSSSWKGNLRSFFGQFGLFR